MNATMAAHRAIFLDRDGTLVHPRHYPSRPADLCLYDGIGPGLRLLHEAGFRLVVVTNQSGLARGYFGADDLTLMHRHLTRELARHGVTLDGIYHCPHHPDGIIPELAVYCDCRKPQPGMVRRAVADLDIDPARSWFVGDILDDVEAGNRAGCRTVLVDLGSEAPPAHAPRRPDFVARETRHALDIIAQCEGYASGVEMSYLPATWRFPLTPHPTGLTGLSVLRNRQPSAPLPHGARGDRRITSRLPHGARGSTHLHDDTITGGRHGRGR